MRGVDSDRQTPIVSDWLTVGGIFYRFAKRGARHKWRNSAISISGGDTR
jgi:hypothetical protein